MTTPVVAGSQGLKEQKEQQGPEWSELPRLSQAGGLELAARRVVEGLYAGRHRSPFHGPAVEFADHRPYQAGDDLRSVDWKVLARSDHLLVRRYREERDLPLTVVLDTSASMAYGEPTKHRWAMIAAAALGWLAVEQGDRVRLIAGAERTATWSAEFGGPSALPQMLSALSALTWQGAGDLPRLLTDLGQRLRRRAALVVFSDLLTDVAAFARPLGALAARGHDVALVQVLDRSEVDLPATWGAARLIDPEGRHTDVACDAAAAKVGYDALMHDHVQQCRRVAAGCRADHVLAVTDQDAADVLGAWLHRRQGRAC